MTDRKMIRVTTLFAALAIFCVSPACGVLRWSPLPADGATVQACLGQEAVFDWNYTLSAGEQVEDIRWNTADGKSNQMIAAYTHGTFFATPTFSGRVRHLGGARLALDHVTKSDEGNYTVDVTVVHHGGGTFLEEHRSAHLAVAAPPVTQGSQLTASQNRQAVYNNATQDWRIKLRCGAFTDLGQPQVDVVWKTPSGLSVPASNYDNGDFELLLENPVEGGNYTCSLDPASPAAVCYHDDDPIMTGAGVSVDEMKARISLLEAGLQTKVAELQKESTELKEALKRQKNELQEEFQKEKDELKASLTQQLLSLQSKLDHFHEAASARVAFHARLSSDITTNNYDTIVLTQVLNNEGNAYSPTTGSFTAPRNGTYSFYASVGIASSSHTAGLYMVLDDETVSGTYSTLANNAQSSSCHAVLHLFQGQRVWLRPYNLINQFWNFATYFSGFLLQADE